MKKRKLSFWEIWNMSFGFLGIQFGFALQGGFMSRIFQTLGAEKDAIPLLWIAAPLTGLLVQPIIGYLSDRTWSPRWGRRRPYFLIGAILSSIALFLVPHSPALWVAAGFLWILDASINISMEPFRALVADKLPDSQRSYGFVTQTLIIGIGTWIASNLPWLISQMGVSDGAPTGVVPMSVKVAFAIGALVFLISILYTVFTTSEYPPEDMEEFEKEKKQKNKFVSDILNNIGSMPLTMKKLGLIQFFSWFALFAMWIYTTSAVTSFHYGSSDTSSAAYNNGADWVGILFAAYNGFAALAALCIPIIVKRVGLKLAHALNLILGALGLASFMFIQEPSLLIWPMIGIGFAWASILSLPYAMLSTSVPSHKMGVYMGIFNFFIVIPQLLAASVLGLILRHFFQNQPIYALMLGAVSFVLAAVAVLRVKQS